MGQEQSAELSPPLLGRFVQGCKCPLVCGIDARVVLDQQGGYVHVLDRGEEVEVKKRKEVVMTNMDNKTEDERGEMESGEERLEENESRKKRRAFNKSKCVESGE